MHMPIYLVNGHIHIYFRCYLSNICLDFSAGERVSGGPVGRGGHQMCLDLTSQTIYLHGGWDGANDLSDLWSYDIERGVWTCICQDTSLVVSKQR